MASNHDDHDGGGKDLEAETSFDIQLYIYDMSKGLAKGLSAMFLGMCCVTAAKNLV